MSEGKLKIIAPLGNPGVPQTEEEYEATIRHLDEFEERLTSGEGLHEHEMDHLITTPEEIKVVRDWIKKARDK